jgi:hypothetical protein
MASETSLRPAEIKDILLREIEAADLHELDVEDVGTLLEVKDGIARIYGLNKAMAGEMLEATSAETGDKITALALNLEEDNIGAVILGDWLKLKCRWGRRCLAASWTRWAIRSMGSDRSPRSCRARSSPRRPASSFASR